MESSIERLELRLDGSLAWMREEMEAQIQQFMVMFTLQNSVRVSPYFPPRERTELILQGNRMNRVNGTFEIEVDLEEELEGMMDRGKEGHVNHHHSGFPMP